MYMTNEQYTLCRNKKFTLFIFVIAFPTVNQTRAGIQRRKTALDSSASFRRELQQNLR